jgi:hypothetical protein
LPRADVRLTYDNFPGKATVMRLYIAGPMSGLPGLNYHAFFDAEKALLDLGHTPLNPARTDGPDAESAIAAAGTLENPAHPWEYYLRRDIPKVTSADALLVLPGWQTSRGANLEVHIAEALGMPMFILRDGKLLPRITVIGLSGYGRSGKDTIGTALQERGYVRAAFADRIREGLYALNPLVTPTERVADLIDAQGWEATKGTHPEIRTLLQRLGAELGRELLGDNIWVDLTFKGVPDGAKVVVTDCRFPNEAATVKRLGGEVWRVQRPGFNPANAHPSETALDDWAFDRVFLNDGTMESLHAQVYDVLDRSGSAAS